MKALKVSLSLAAYCLAVSLATPAQDQSEKPQAAGSATAAPDAAASAMTVSREYLLGPNDVIVLKVFGEPQMDGDYPVDSDGNITIPFLDEPIAAQCRDVKALRKDVTAALGKFLRDPRVYVGVRERRARRPATVYGAVRTPLNFEMHRPARLLELLSQSGGVTEQQSGVIKITHTQPLLCGEVDRVPSTQAASSTDAIGLPFELYRVADLKAGKPEANPYIRPGDIIEVSEASPVYITGNVVQPSNLYLRENTTLTRALAQVGGVRDANEEKVRIYRQKPGQAEPEIVMVNYKAIRQGKEKDVLLQPYDIIEVPKRGVFTPEGILKTLAGMATGGAQSIMTNAPLRILY